MIKYKVSMISVFINILINNIRIKCMFSYLILYVIFFSKCVKNIILLKKLYCNILQINCIYFGCGRHFVTLYILSSFSLECVVDGEYRYKHIKIN